jgi:hypothetical protein
MQPTKTRMSRNNVLLVAFGLALWIWVIAHAGPSALMHQLRALKLALPIVIGISLIRLLLQSVTWSAALKRQGLEVGLPRLMGIRQAAQGMGYLTVFGPVLSEPMKINLLSTPVEATATATFLDNGVYWLTSALVGIAGCVSVSLMRARGAFSTLALCAMFILIILFIAGRKSALASLTRKLGRRSPSWLSKGSRIETAIREIRRQQPQLVRRLFWLDMTCQLLLVLEVAVVLWFLRLPVHMLTLAAIEGITRGVKMMTGFVPARLGADEGGAMSAFAAAGFSPTLGLTLALTRRVRDLTFALAGLAWLASRSHSAKGDALLPEGALACKS